MYTLLLSPIVEAVLWLSYPTLPFKTTFVDTTGPALNVEMQLWCTTD